MTTTYKGILRDQIGGNGITPLYGWGQRYQGGHIPRQRFIDVLGKQQDYFRSVVESTLAGKMGQEGSIEEADGIGSQQFQYLDQLLSRGDWGENPTLIEGFVEEVTQLRGEEYERPEWLNKLLSETGSK